MINLVPELVQALASPEAKKALTDIMRDVLREDRKDAVPELLDIHGASALLTMSIAALRKACSRGKIPHSRLGAKLRFRRAELLALLTDD